MKISKHEGPRDEKAFTPRQCWTYSLGIDFRTRIKKGLAHKSVACAGFTEDPKLRVNSSQVGFKKNENWKVVEKTLYLDDLIFEEIFLKN